MNAENGDGTAGGEEGALATFGAELRGTLMLEALIAACAIISYADSKSSLVERWRLLEVLTEDPLLAALPKGVMAEEWSAHRRAFASDPITAQAQALQTVARLAPEPQKGRMVLEACIRVMTADRQANAKELEGLHKVKEALRL